MELVRNFNYHKERKERADRIRNIRRMVRLLVDEHDRDKDIAERRKKTIKVVVNNENSQ